MSLDGAILGNLAAEQMEALEEAYEDDDVQIGTAITIVEVVRVHTRDEDGTPVVTASDVRVRFNSGEPFQVMGILDQAKFNLLAGPGLAPPDSD